MERRGHVDLLGPDGCHERFDLLLYERVVDGFLVGEVLVQRPHARAGGLGNAVGGGAGVAALGENPSRGLEQGLHGGSGALLFCFSSRAVGRARGHSQGTPRTRVDKIRVIIQLNAKHATSPGGFMASIDYHYTAEPTRNPLRYLRAVWRLVLRDPETTTDEAAIVEMGFARSKLGRRFARWEEVARLT